MSTIHLLTSDNYFTTLRDLINSSSHSIYILLYQFNRYIGNPNSKVNLITHSLLKAHTRGVLINIILNNSFKIPRESLVNAQTVEYFRHHGIPARLGPKNLRIHSKMFIVDKFSVVLGSHNLSERALNKNVEFSLLIHSKPLAEQLFNIFTQIWNTP